MFKTTKAPSSVPAPQTFSLTVDSDKEILIETRVSARTSRLRLFWLNERNIFILRHPPFVTTADIKLFLHTHQMWMQKIIEKTPQKKILSIGDSFSFFGEIWHLRQDPLRKKGIWRVDQNLIIGKNVENLQQMVENVLRKEAQKFFTLWSARYATQIGATFTKISIRDGRSRWGSCSSSGSLSYSWRLGLAPLEIAHYVCAHEVAHLKEMNHSSRFWLWVERLDPFYKRHRAWLKKEGNSLKHVLFSDKKISPLC